MSGLLDVLLPVILLLFPTYSSSYPQCINSRAPFKLEAHLKFCPQNGTGCCDLDDDLQVQNQFEAMNTSNPECASLIKSILCARCNQFAAQLFQLKSEARNVPALCNFTDSAESKNGALTDFCTNIWDTCIDTFISNTPFVSSLRGKDNTFFDPSPSKLITKWKSRNEFCGTFGSSSADGAVCFNGENEVFMTTEPPKPLNGLCLEKIRNGSFLNMIPHPDGSNRVFLSNQQGLIWLVNIPEVESKGFLDVDELKLFIDLTDHVLFGTDYGLMGITFHPKFEQNGRFFASFNCDKLQHRGCQGRCACNTDVNCDPSTLNPDNGIQPCQYHIVVSEFTANNSASKHSLATTVNPVEVRRIFTMGLPYTGAHGGQLLFGPADGYLYLMTGDCSGGSNAFNFAQNKKSLLGKILRLDIDNIMPDAAEITRHGLWGNYSIPTDNPYVNDDEFEPEIWALGFRNPWRCSFDSERPSYFLCGDCGQDEYEEVDIVTKGGNYGWRVYEGPYVFHPKENSPQSPITNPIFPVMGYNHPSVNNNTASASVTGGYFYRSKTDPCMYGRYLYADLYGHDIWAGTEVPKNSGNFSSANVSVRCANDSTIQCSSDPASNQPALGYILSFAEDNNKDVYILSSNGVYRVARPSRCSYQCSIVEPSHGPEYYSVPISADAGKIASLSLFLCFVYPGLCLVTALRLLL